MGDKGTQRGVLWRGLVVGASAALALAAPLVAVAGAASFSTPGHNVDKIGGGQSVAPGDNIAVGFAIQVHNGNNPEATLYLENAEASITFACEQNPPPNSTQTQTLTIAIPPGPYDFPAGYKANGGWWPTNQWSNYQTYDAETTAPNFCDGGAMYVVNNGESYSGTLASTNDTSDQFHIQLHTAIPAAVNNGSNVDCASSSDNPTQGNGQGSNACNFNQNGDQDNLVPEAYTESSSTPTPTPTPSQAPPPSSPPSSNPPQPSGSSGAGSPTGASGASNPTGTGGGVAANGAPQAAHVFYPTTVLGAHTALPAIAGGLQGQGSGAPASSPVRTAAVSSGRSEPSSQPQASPAASSSRSPWEHVSTLLPAAVVAPLSAAAGSLLAQLPVQWYALLAAVDCALVLAIIARRDRARESAIKSQVQQ